MARLAGAGGGADMTVPVRIALLGAESSGKTTLAAALADSLRTAGRRVVLVPEVLREWCDARGRVPRADEQRGIAEEQARRAMAVQEADVVVADTAPVMTAVYSDMLFGDRSLYPFALRHQRIYDATLLTGLDLPWVADGLQRDGAQVRAPVDAMVRAVLGEGGIAWRVVYGSGEERLASALSALGPLAGGAAPRLAESATAAWNCLNCDEAACEHRLFTSMVRPAV